MLKWKIGGVSLTLRSLQRHPSRRWLRQASR
jgi:hypothetical protein